jgi:hypothetical protein
LIQSLARKKADSARRQRETKATSNSPLNRSENTKRLLATIIVATLLAGIISCKSISDPFGRDVRPLVMRDVPAQRLAYRFEADIVPPPEIKNEDADDKIESIQLDFNTRRQDDALLRTVRSPDGQRALVLYGTSDEPSQAFRIDLYSAEGSFLRNVTPPDISCVFAEAVAWSPDGNFITFIAHKSVKPTPTPTPPGGLQPEPLAASPLPSIAPAFASIAVFNTEQIYICNRDGYDLKPLTSREGLIYFYSSWAPDNHALVALACRESEWDAREREFKLPAGRPRLIALDGSERLLADELTEALPVWSPDSSKVATAFDADVMIYDAATTKPTQARIRLGDALIAASRVYERKPAAAKDQADANNAPAVESGDDNGKVPASFNPTIRLEWLIPEKLLFQTAYVRLIPNEPISTFQRWHILTLSPQAAVLK